MKKLAQERKKRRDLLVGRLRNIITTSFMKTDKIFPNFLKPITYFFLKTQVIFQVFLMQGDFPVVTSAGKSIPFSCVSSFLITPQFSRFIRFTRFDFSRIPQINAA